MKNPPEKKPEASAFERFKTAMRSILSVPKSAVVEEEKRQKQERAARRKT